jgi:hypothetical protein
MKAGHCLAEPLSLTAAQIENLAGLLMSGQGQNMDKDRKLTPECGNYALHDVVETNTFFHAGN